MPFQTGTVDQVNDLLDVFAGFLEDNGWTIIQNYKRPITHAEGVTALDPPPGTEPIYFWHTARNMVATKGACTMVFEDFYQTPARVYGNFGGGLGPGIAATMVPSAGSGTGFFDSDFPDFHSYDMLGPAFFGPTNIAGPTAPQSANGARQKTVVMPLPSINAQFEGSWKASTHIMSPAGVTNFPGNFGEPGFGGALIPATYWMMCDATGDNVILVVLRDRGDVESVRRTPYLFFGTSIKKGGAWAGGQYFGASHGNDTVWTNNATPSQYAGFRTFRFGGPGTMMDGAEAHMFVKVDVDSFVGKWVSFCNTGDGNVSTGRNMSSTTIMIPKAPDIGGAAGVTDNGIHVASMRGRRSTLGSGAPMFPTYLVVQRDNGLYSLLGALPHIFQANTEGIAPGFEWTDKSGQAYMIFDGFAVRKDP